MLGIVSIKLTMLGRFGSAGWPDYIFLCPNAKIYFVEFKRAGKLPTELQRVRIHEIENQGFEVFVIDNVTAFHNTLVKYVDAPPVHVGRRPLPSVAARGGIVSRSGVRKNRDHLARFRSKAARRQGKEIIGSREASNLRVDMAGRNRKMELVDESGAAPRRKKTRASRRPKH